MVMVAAAMAAVATEVVMEVANRKSSKSSKCQVSQTMKLIESAFTVVNFQLKVKLEMLDICSSHSNHVFCEMEMSNQVYLHRVFHISIYDKAQSLIAFKSAFHSSTYILLRRRDVI